MQGPAKSQAVRERRKELLRGADRPRSFGRCRQPAGRSASNSGVMFGQRCKR